MITLSRLLPTLFAAALVLAAGAAAAEDEFLPVEEAFKLSLKPSDNGQLSAEFSPAPTYYLYRDRITFAVKSPADGSVKKVNMPAGEKKNDQYFGQVEVYHHPFVATLELDRGAAASQPVELEATYQGCSEKGLCYPPVRKTFTLLTDAAGTPAIRETAEASAISAARVGEPAQVNQGLASATKAAPAESGQSETTAIANLFKSGSLWLVLVSFFGFGLLLAFTPCVFPMIPILSGIIVGQGDSITKSKAFILSVAYVLGMAITYSAAGVAAGLSGSLISAALQNPWVLGSFAMVFVALSFSMFGFYDLQLPGALQSRLTETSNNLKGGQFFGVFTMGALSALIVGPCVAAPLAGALLYIGQTRNVVLGGSALFAMALGMGVPLLLVGTSAGALLPRAGAWMEGVKKFFGVMLLAVAIWLISSVIPPVATMLLAAILLIGSGVYLRAIDPLPAEAGGFTRLWKSTGVVALVAGVALMIGGLAGGRDILQPLAGLRSTGEATAQGTPVKFERIATASDLDSRLTAAAGKPVMLDFYADWCTSCKEMEHFTFSDPRVQAKLQGALLLQADVTANNASHKELLKRFGLFGPPGIIFFDAKGNEVKSMQVVGYQPPEKFLVSLQSLDSPAVN